MTSTATRAAPAVGRADMANAIRALAMDAVEQAAKAAVKRATDAFEITAAETIVWPE